jgi:hypothetical protein
MATEAVQVIISADDQASQKFAQVAANAENAVRKIKDTTKATKSTAEFTGVLGNLLGGTQLGQAAGQIGQISEKMSQFSEVSAKGGAGAIAFQAGLFSLAATLGFQLGSALGNIIFQVEDYNAKLEKSAQRTKELAEESQRLLSKAFTQRMQDIEFIRNPEQKSAEYKQLNEETSRGLLKVEGDMARLRQEIVSLSTWQGYLNDKRHEEIGLFDNVSAERAEDLKQRQAELELAKENFNRLQKELEAINDLTNVRAIANAEQRKRNDELTKEEGYIQTLEKQLALITAKNVSQARFNQLTAEQNTFTETSFIEAQKILAAIDEQNKIAEEQKRKADESKKAVEEEKRKQEQITQLIKTQTQSLELRRIALEKGNEAAKVQALINQGMDADAAKKMAAEDAALTAEEKKLEAAKQLEESRKKILADLEKEKILIERGAEAARKFALEQQGFTAQEAAALAKQEADLKRREDAKQAGGVETSGPAQAKESRLLTRGTQDQLAISKEQLAALYKIADNLNKLDKNPGGLRGVRVLN